MRKLTDKERELIRERLLNMAGADKKQHTRGFIKDVIWYANRAFIYGYINEGTSNEEIERYAVPYDLRFRDDLLPVLYELAKSQDLANLLEFAKNVIGRLPTNVLEEVRREAETNDEDKGDEEDEN